MRNLLVGGPLLGRCRRDHDDDTETSNRRFEPLITAPIRGERYILLPSRTWVTVLAYRTGHRFVTLLPSSPCHTDEDEKNESIHQVEMESMALVRYLSQDRLRRHHHHNQQGDEYVQVLWVACHDGTLRDYNLSEILGGYTSNSTKELRDEQCRVGETGSYYVPGTCYGPSRIIRISDQPVRQLSLSTIESSATNPGCDIVAHALIQNNGDKKGRKVHSSLIRVRLPLNDERVTEQEASVSNEPTVLDFQNDSLGKIHSIDENISYQSNRTFPFRLITVVRPRPGSHICAFVLLARSSSLTIYMELFPSGDGTNSPAVKDKRVHGNITIEFPEKDPLSSICISKSQKNVACGHASGTIRVYNDLLPLVEAYVMSMAQYRNQPESRIPEDQEKPLHPRKLVIVQKLHWHVHPVASLVYEGTGDSGDNDILISGGEESVMVTWHLARGTSHPTDVLPRIALGGILHIACTAQPTGAPDAILICCADNSLHLFQSHNRALIWKVQGLAAEPEPGQPESSHRPQMRADPHADYTSPRVWLWGLSQAPGRIQSFDPRTQQVESNLDVAPFNRVSRTEPGDCPMPVLCVTHASWSESGEDLLTIDTTTTENASVGSKQEVAGLLKVGVITTLRLWSTRVPSTKMYELVAAMAFPHGSQNRVSSAVLSPDGMHACTVSNDEKAFRLWHRILDSEDSEASSKNQVAWTCRYKVAFPSGFSNYPTGHSAVTFSSDASVLAVAFGNIITLWDQDEVTLLSSLHHVDDDDSPIDSLHFVQSAFCPDMLLATSGGGISLQSPFGDQGQSSLGWTSTLSGSDGLRITNASYVENTDSVSVAIYNKKTNQTRFLFINAATGHTCGQFESDSLIIVGQVVSVACSAALHGASWNGDETATTSEHTIQRFALTRDGEMMSLSNGPNDEFEKRPSTGRGPEIPSVPRLPMVAGSGKPSHRKRAFDVLCADDIVGHSKKLSLENFGSFVGGEATALSSAQLPQLSGAFVQAFVGRRLQRE